METAGLLALEDAIDKLAVEELGAAPVGGDLQRLFALRARLDAQISRRVGMFDANNEWVDDGCRSAAGWLVKHCRTRHGTARQHVRVARQVRHMPNVADAWERGTTTTEHVEVLARARRAARADERFAEFEPAFSDVAEAGTPEDVEMVARQWRDAVENERQNMDDPAGRQHESRGLDIAEILDGVRLLSGRADALAGRIIERAINVEVDKAHKQDDPRTPSQERMDALTAICAQHLAGNTGGNSRPHILLHTDEATLRGTHVGRCETDTGDRISPEAMRRMACDAFISRTVMGAESEVLDLGRAQRTFTAAQRRAIIARYHTCIGVGCKVPAAECEMHHVDWWEYGGATDLANGVPVCGHEHWLLHDGRWSITLEDTTGTVNWYRPNGSYHGETRPGVQPKPIPIRRRRRE